MKKVITLIARRPGTTRAAFKDYYEQNHAPLGTRYFPFDKYIRNHLNASVPEDVGFDVLMECWLDQEKAYAILTGDIVKIFDEDEARFMNAPPRPVGVDAIEHLLIGPPRGVDPRGTQRVALFIKNIGGLDETAFYQRVAAWGRALAEETGAIRVIMDEVVPGHVSTLFKGDALLHFWSKGTATLPNLEPPAGLLVEQAMTLDSQETTPEELAANFGNH
ncbi:MAG: hypothetical protein JWM91_1568 [Rhodospirillales bacterium]|nr:hypothetical protein [Rhodospirillales bacterium]